MRRSLAPTALAVVTVAGSFLVGCGDDGDDEAAGGGDGGASEEDPCVLFERIAEIDSSFQAATIDIVRESLEAQGTADEEAVREQAGEQLLEVIDEQLQDRVPELLAAYDGLAEQLDGEASEAATTLRENTEQFAAELEEVDDIDDIGSIGAGAEDAGEATLTLDEEAQERCDTSILGTPPSTD